jgi:NADPH:quinone reductase-like Zn-dependent oxidoreductase
MEEVKKFNAVLTDLQKPYFTEVDGRELNEGEILVRVEAAPINPSDQHLAIGNYGIKQLLPQPPFGVGGEGSGIVIEVRPLLSF